MSLKRRSLRHDLQARVDHQTPRAFDFEGSRWPPQFHYTGPFHDGAGRAEVDFPWDRLLDGKAQTVVIPPALANNLQIAIIQVKVACQLEVLQLCSHPVIGWQDAPPGIFGLWVIQVAAL